MAKIKAFKGLRPNEKITDKVAALPYDVYDRREAKAEVEREPLSFLRIDRAETQFAEEMDPYDPAVYQKAQELLRKMVSDGSFIQDEKECFYLYELTMNGRTQTGLVACSSLDDYLNQVIKKHENTLDIKLQDRIHHIDSCNAQTGPVFLAYRKNQMVTKYLNQQKQEDTIFDFVSPDGIRHRGWCIKSDEQIRQIIHLFSEIPYTYIADGHHRAESAVRVSLMRRAQEKEKKAADLEREYDYFLSVLFAEDELNIMDYNRVVKDLHGLTEKEFLQEVKKICHILPLDEYKDLEKQGHPCKKGNMRMYLSGKWYDLQIRAVYQSQDPVNGLDVSILQQYILDPVLGIKNPKKDNRIQFVGGIRGLQELTSLADRYHGTAFVMFPTSMEELLNVADAGRLMPPKSTWFEPKLRSGLFIHQI